VNPLRRLLLGSGRFPEGLRAELQAEHAEVLEEGLRGSITYRGYRAPGRRYSFRKVAVSGAIALTQRRLVVRVGRGQEVDLALDDARLSALRATLDEPDRLCLAFDAGAFRDDRSGTVELRLTTARAGRVVELLGSRR
jgi:hypothetical protein